MNTIEICRRSTTGTYTIFIQQRDKDRKILQTWTVSNFKTKPEAEAYVEDHRDHLLSMKKVEEVA